MTRYQLIFRIRKASLQQPDDVERLEHALAQRLGDTAELDGHDAGKRDIDFFIMTADPAAAFRRSKAALEELALLDRAVVAHRLEGGARFTVLWPLGYARRFILP